MGRIKNLCFYPRDKFNLSLFVFIIDFFKFSVKLVLKAVLTLSYKVR